MTVQNQFKPGQSGNPVGRPPGIKNKKVFNVAEILDKIGFDPFSHLADIAKNSKSETARCEATSQLAQYVSPKLKSVEHTTAADNSVQINLNFAAKKLNDAN